MEKWTCQGKLANVNEALISLVFSKFSKLPLSLCDSGNFVKTLKICMKLILNHPRAHAITYTNQKNPYFEGGPNLQKGVQIHRGICTGLSKSAGGSGLGGSKICFDTGFDSQTLGHVG